MRAAVGLTAREAERAGCVDVDIGESVPGADYYAGGYTGRARIAVDHDMQEECRP